MFNNFTSMIHIDCWGHWPVCLPVYYAHSQVSFKWNGETCPLSAQCAWNTIPALGIPCPADHTMHIGHRPHWARHRLPWSWESYESRESPELQNVKFSIHVGKNYFCIFCRSFNACSMKKNYFVDRIIHKRKGFPKADLSLFSNTYLRKRIYISLSSWLD